MKKLLILLILSFISISSNLFAEEANFVYSASSDGTVRKLDSSGNQVWSFTGHTNQVMDIAVDLNGNVYSGSRDNTVRKIDPDGNQVWSFNASSGVEGVAVDQNEFVYVALLNSNVLKIDPDGNQVWAFTNHTNFLQGISVDLNGFVYSAGGDNTVRKIDPDGNQVWSFTGHSSFVGDVAVDLNGFVYSASFDNTVRKIDPDGNQVWSFTGHTSDVEAIAVGQDGFVYSAGDDDTIRKIDSSGNQIWSFTGFNNKITSVISDIDGYVYGSSTDGSVRKIDPDANQVWSFTGHTSNVNGVATNQTLPLQIPEPPEYNVELQTNTPYNDFIYQDDEVNVTTDSVITTILNDESFTVTSTAQSLGSYTFNYWYDLDNMEVYSTSPNFTILDPSRSYNLIADYTLNDFNTFNINSNLPSPQDFKLNTTTLEGQSLTINQSEFINYQHPDDRDWEIIAPITNIGFYEFDYYYNNDGNDIYSFSNVISGSGFSPPNLTAVYSLPEEYQINLIIESNIGNIIFQHGNNDPISGPFISQTIGLGDDWTATAPSNQDYQFDMWFDLNDINVFSNNQTINIINTNKDYYLEAIYIDLVDITWDSNGGTQIPQQTVVINSSIQPPPEPTRPGFVFNRWEDSLGNPVTFPVTITEDVTFTADWIETYTLTYDTNGGGRIDADTYLENAIPEVVTPSRFGYEFTGWFTDDGTFQNAYEFTDPITQDTTIHAKWAFGSDRDAQLSLTTFLDDNDLGDGFSQIVIMITIYIFVNIIILIYQAPLIVTLILNFIVTSLFMILGWIAIWIVVVIFMSLFGLLYFFSSGRGITE